MDVAGLLRRGWSHPFISLFAPGRVPASRRLLAGAGDLTMTVIWLAVLDNPIIPLRAVALILFQLFRDLRFSLLLVGRTLLSFLILARKVFGLFDLFKM